MKVHGADYIIAVDVRFGGKGGSRHKKALAFGAEAIRKVSFGSKADAKYKVQNIFDVISIALKTSQFDKIEQQFTECNILIQPDLSCISLARFDLVRECMEIGMEETKKHLPAIKKDLYAMGVI